MITMGSAPQRSPPARRALLVDVLGTLVRLTPPVAPLRAEMAARFGVHLTEAQAAAALASEISYYRRHLQQGSDLARLGQLRRQCAEVLRAAMPPSRELMEISPHALTEALLSSLRFSAFPDAAPALRGLRRRPIAIVAVSNWDVSLHEVLARLSLAELLDAIVTSAEVGVRKPTREVFDHALALVGVEPQDAVHVGDSMEEDVAGARAAGIEPILLARTRPAGHPAGVRVISSLRELAVDA